MTHDDWPRPGRILETALALAQGAMTSARLVAEALDRAEDPAGEGARVFTRLYRDSATVAAAANDRLRGVGIVASPLMGLPVTVKDLFDRAGETTTAGSIVLKNAPPAQRDAEIIQRLRAAGAIILGKTNMTEFAYSGVGLNPHYGTPRNIFDRATGRIPGGSSAGAAIAVTDAMGIAGIGTDTGGSVRIPAALNGLVGFKPTARRVSREGAFPLSTTLDSIGPLAESVADCAMVDAVLAGEAPAVPAPIPLRGLRLAVPRHYVLDDLDPEVARAFASALSRLSAGGAVITEVPFNEFEELPGLNAQGGFSAAEAYAAQRQLIARSADQYDPRVLTRIRRGAAISAADYLDLMAARTDLINRVDLLTLPYDSVIMPTVPCVAPPIQALASDQEYARVNLLILRNPSIVNFLDRCAVTVPCHPEGAAPVGLSLMGERLGDRRLLAIARAAEAALGPIRE